jgi:rhamnulokinase
VSRLGIPAGILKEIVFPGTVIGRITDEVKGECGIRDDVSLVAVHSHDSASAIVGAPLESRRESAFVNCGTWAVIGTVLEAPVINQETLEQNITNQPLSIKETAMYRFISGMWLLQRCRSSWEKRGQRLNYDDINSSAARAEPFLFRINPDDPRFINPPDMAAEIEACCRETGQKVPQDCGQMARGIYESLALSYHDIISRMEALLGRTFKTINLIGGGCQAQVLRDAMRQLTGKKVAAGPVEATAMGNMITQMKAMGDVGSWEEGIEVIKRSVKFTTQKA